VATANTALVRTAQRLSVSVRAYLPPHNFTVMLQIQIAESGTKDEFA